jgi:hypothetical protein
MRETSLEDRLVQADAADSVQLLGQHEGDGLAAI